MDTHTTNDELEKLIKQKKALEENLILTTGSISQELNKVCNLIESKRKFSEEKMSNNKNVDSSVKQVEHLQKEIILKTARIDENIIPVVEWINSINCCTIACCQGHESSINPCSSHPYVVFTCWNYESLQHIISVCKYFDNVNHNAIELTYEKSLSNHSALSQVISLDLNNEACLQLFSEHIKGLATSNKNGAICYEVLPRISLI